MRRFIAPRCPDALSSATFAALLGAAAATASAVALAPAPERPRDPFVYRCVLDGNARMVVVSLAPDLAAAYDARSCGLALAWTGRVTFQGAVYDTTHGPQPVHEGAMRLVADDGPAWMLQAGDAAPVPAGVRWLGYRIQDDMAHLRFELSAPGLPSVVVTETPEVRRDAGGAPILERRFAVDGPDDVTVHLVGPRRATTDSTGADEPGPAAALGTNGRPPRRTDDGALLVPLAAARDTVVTIAELTSDA